MMNSRVNFKDQETEVEFLKGKDGAEVSLRLDDSISFVIGYDGTDKSLLAGLFEDNKLDHVLSASLISIDDLKTIKHSFHSFILGDQSKIIDFDFDDPRDNSTFSVEFLKNDKDYSVVITNTDRVSVFCDTTEEQIIEYSHCIHRMIMAIM